MSYRSRRKRIREFRIESLTQSQGVAHPKPSARELFPELRARLRASRPLLEVVEHPHLKDAKGRPLRFERLGRPTFRNVIDENGKHV